MDWGGHLLNNLSFRSNGSLAYFSQPLEFKYHFTTSYGTDVGSYHCPPLEKLDIDERFTLWIAFTLDPFFGTKYLFLVTHRLSIKVSMIDT